MTGPNPAWLAVLLLGCALPDFSKVDPSADSGADATGASVDSGLGTGPTCGLSNQLPADCNTCIMANCCELAEACPEGSACGEDLLEPITPVAVFSEDFDPLLGCMQLKCNDECQVDWGCVGDYEWPIPDDSYDMDVTVVDFAAVPEEPIEGVTVQACRSIDPACDNGEHDRGVSDADGKVQLNVPATFGGFFTFSGAGYHDATAQWTEPVYRISEWTQFQLTADAVKALALITGVHETQEQTFADDRGHLIFRMQNCLPMRFLGNIEVPRADVSGVSVSFEPNEGASDIFYTDPQGGLSVTLEETSADGVGGSFDVSTRNIAVTAVDRSTGDQVSEGTIRVREGSIGFIYMLPTAAN